MVKLSLTFGMFLVIFVGRKERHLIFNHYWVTLLSKIN